MRAIDFFMRAGEFEAEVKSLVAAKIKAMEMAQLAVSSTEERVSGGNVNRVEKKYMALAEYSERLDDKLYELYKIQNEIFEVVRELDDSRHRVLLMERYINCQTWEAVASRMDYSLRQVMRLHDDVLKAAQVVIECRTRNAV